jgi:hypothetical protein
MLVLDSGTPRHINFHSFEQRPKYPILGTFVTVPIGEIGYGN